MRQSQKYHAEWNNISVLLTKATFLQVKKYIFQLTKYEHNDVRIESDGNNLSSIGFVE